MNKKEYLKKRNELLNKAQELLNAGALEELQAVKTEIEQLDNEFEKISKEQANLQALEGKVDVVNLANESVQTNGAAVIGSVVAVNEVNYEDVFAKVALKRELNNAEIEVFNKYNPENAYTHTTENTEVVIPSTVVAGIDSVMKELHPILADVVPTHIKGLVTYTKHTGIEEGDADYYTENETVADEKNVFGKLTLGGKELAKAVTVTWKLQSMAVNEFIPFIKRELGERMAAAKAKAFVKGAGDNEYPQGIITAINDEGGTPQKITFASTGLTYEDLTAGMAKIKSMYKTGAKIYANNATVWNALANITDGQGRPLFIPDVTTGGVGRIFGLPVFEEDALDDNEIIMGNMRAGYKVNVQDEMKLVTEQHAKKRNTDFVGYEVHDGGVYDTKAFAYLVKGV